MHNNTILNSCSKHFCVQFFPHLNYQLIKLMMMHQQMQIIKTSEATLNLLGRAYEYGTAMKFGIIKVVERGGVARNRAVASAPSTVSISFRFHPYPLYPTRARGEARVAQARVRGARARGSSPRPSHYVTHTHRTAHKQCDFILLRFFYSFRFYNLLGLVS